MKMYGCAGRQLINIDSLPPTMGTISMPCTAFFTYTAIAYNPSSIYSWFLKPLSVLNSQFPTKKSWVLSYFWQKKNSSQFKKKKKNFFLKQLFSADATM